MAGLYLFERQAHNLGIFTKKSEAILARKLAERRLFQPILQQEIVTINKED